MTTLIAEDLVLLLLDDESGKFANATWLDTGIGGALLVDLALAGNVEVVKGSGVWARAKVLPTPAPAPSDPVLHDALEVVAHKERTAQDLVARLGKRRRDQLLERLRERGILERREDRVLGLVHRRRWPTLDATHEAGVRRELGDALVRGARPEQRTAALVALLSALDLAHKVIDREGLPAREVKQRAREIAEGDWSAKAVKDAVAAAQAAMTAAVVAATTVTVTSG
jgi:hypothetical protein